MHFLDIYWLAFKFFLLKQSFYVSNKSTFNIPVCHFMDGCVTALLLGKSMGTKELFMI